MRYSHDLKVYETVDGFMKNLNPSNFVYSRKKYLYYVDITATFDIETTNTEDDGFAYSYAFNIGGNLIVLRYIEDVFNLIDNLSTFYKLDDKHILTIYVHNLGYEHMYTTQQLSEIYERKSILLTAARKALTIKYRNGLELRDSFKLFQKSLAKATKGLPHEKLVGDLDYNIYRTPDTFLKQHEFDYIVNDVQGLYEAIERLKAEHGYNAATIPLTNTAMVIEAVNKYCNKSRSCMYAMRKLTLNKHQLMLAYKAMAGGDTHGCRWRAGITYENCNSNDFKSAHPSQQLLRKFPSGAPIDLPDEVEEEDLNNLIENEYGWLGLCYIVNPIIKETCPDPTISFSKCKIVNDYGDLDNGRVLSASEMLVYMDSNDYQRFVEAYDYDDFVLVEGFCFKLDYLPEAYRAAILHYFDQKENADGSDRDFAKICVNTIFGASAQKVIRDEWELCEKTLDTTHQGWEDTLFKASDSQVFKKQQMKFPFLWGLWTSSCTRLELFKMLKIIGWERVLYWDTDSCKYIGEKSTEIEKYNDNIRELCKERNCVITNKKGNAVYIGVAEDEHKTVDYGYKKFRFLHAKCYAAEAWNGEKYEFEITIAGVQKDKGKAALKSCDNLRDGFYIGDAGGYKLKYVDKLPQLRTDFERPTTTASFIYMQPRDYLISEH